MRLGFLDASRGWRTRASHDKQWAMSGVSAKRPGTAEQLDYTSSPHDKLTTLNLAKRLKVYSSYYVAICSAQIG